MKTIALGLAAALAGLAVLGLYQHTGGKAEGGPAERTLTGTVEAREVDIAPEIGGRIASWTVEEGQRVKKGDLLVTLEDQPVRLRVARLEAALATAQAEVANLRAPGQPSAIQQQRSRVAEAHVALDEAQVQLARVLALSDRSATSPAEVQNAELAVRAARQRLETERDAVEVLRSGARPTEVAAAEARVAEQAREVDLARLDLARTRIVAPIDGVVLRRHHDVGELVTAGTPLYTLLNTATMWVELAADERVHGSIVVGEKADLVAEAAPGQHIAGHVGFVADQHAFTPKSAQTRDDRAMLTFRVKVMVDQPPPFLKPGMYVDVTLRP